MSIWKDSNISIKQIAEGRGVVYGLGGDGKVYLWNFQEGAWEKHWEEKDIPS